MKKLIIISSIFVSCAQIFALEMDELIQNLQGLIRELQEVEVVLDAVVEQEQQQESSAQKEKGSRIQKLEAIITQYGLRDFSTLGNKPLSSAVFDSYTSQLRDLSGYATTQENASYSYIIARDFLEYLDQRFLKQLFSYVEAAKNKPLDIERQLNALAKNYATFANISASDNAQVLARVLSDMLQSLELYAESIDLNNKNPLTIRYEDFKIMVENFTLLCMNTILANFDAASRYKNDGLSQALFTQAQFDLYVQAFKVYKELNPKSSLVTAYGARINELRDWIDKKPTTGGDLSPKEKQRKQEQPDVEPPVKGQDEDTPEKTIADREQDFYALQEKIELDYKKYKADPSSFDALAKQDILKDITRYQQLGISLEDELGGFEISGNARNFRLALSKDVGGSVSVDIQSKLAALKKAQEEYTKGPRSYILAQSQRSGGGVDAEYAVRASLLTDINNYELAAQQAKKSVDSAIANFKVQLINDMKPQLEVEMKAYYEDSSKFKDYLSIKITRLQLYSKNAQAVGIAVDTSITQFLDRLINDEVAILDEKIKKYQTNKNLFIKDADFAQISGALNDTSQYINLLKRHGKEIPNYVEALKDKLDKAFMLRQLLTIIREKKEQYDLFKKMKDSSPRSKELIGSLLYDLNKYIDNAPQIGMPQNDIEPLIQFRNELIVAAGNP